MARVLSRRMQMSSDRAFCVNKAKSQAGGKECSQTTKQDYIMRMIKEIARVLASVMLGKKYVQVELPVETKYQISGDKLHHV